MLRRIWLEDVGEMRRLRLGRDAHAFRAVAREARLGIHAGLCNPNRVILFDGRLNCALKPLSVIFKIRTIQLIVDLKGQVGKKRWLGAREVVRATAIEDLIVVLDLENEVVNNALSHLNLAVNEKSEGDEIGLPVVELCVRYSADQFDDRR